MNTVISMENVSKFFGNTTALNGYSMEVQPGSVVGLIGLNGAGKTTTMKLLTGLLKPNSGSVEVMGEDPWHMGSTRRKNIGFLSEEDFPFPDMDFGEAARFNSRFYRNWDEEYLRNLIDLLDIPLHTPYTDLSRGEQRKFHLVLVLAPKPDLLLLDDPASGLDVTVRRDFIKSILPLLEEQKSTVLFSSHIMSDVERIANSVAIIHEGRNILHRSLDRLKQEIKRVVVTGPSVSPPPEGTIKSEQTNGETVLIVDRPSDEDLDQLRTDPRTVTVHSMNLEDIFVEIVEGQTPNKRAG